MSAVAASLPHPEHGRVVAATIVTADLDGHVDLYSRFFDYRVEHRGAVTRDQAELWGAPAMAGARQAVMRTGSGADSWLRLVEDVDAEPLAPMRTLGWSAIEVAVVAVDGLHEPFAVAPWRIIGAPADLSFTDAIRAMQVAGPMGEVFYLTQIKRQLPGFDLPDAAAPIDRLFVLILGCRDTAAAARFYETLFGCPAAPGFNAEIRVVNGAYGLEPGTKIPLATITTGGRSLIEIDGFPAAAAARTAAPGRLSAGTAIGTFYAADLDKVGADWIAPPRRLDMAPYAGRRAGVVRGPAGELTEVIEIGR